MGWRSIAAAMAVAAFTVGAVSPASTPAPHRRGAPAAATARATKAPHAIPTKAATNTNGSRKGGNANGSKPAKPATPPPKAGAPASPTPNPIVVNVAIFRAKHSAFGQTTAGGNGAASKKEASGSA